MDKQMDKTQISSGRRQLEAKECITEISLLKQEQANGKKIKIYGHRLHSNRMVRCLTNVEAFILRANDLEEVTSLFARFLRNPRVQGAIRYDSPYWRSLAAIRIQVAWRYRKKRLSRADTNMHPSTSQMRN
ncbi:Putative cyclic nucleotide-gated ion channel 19 [Ancistrocladus abbreviatus]